MKKNLFCILVMAMAVVVLALSCQKSRYCLCVNNDTSINDTMIVNVEPGLSCKHIVELGIQKQDSGHFKVDSIYSYTCLKLHKDSLQNYPRLHM